MKAPGLEEKRNENVRKKSREEEGRGAGSGNGYMVAVLMGNDPVGRCQLQVERSFGNHARFSPELPLFSQNSNFPTPSACGCFFLSFPISSSSSHAQDSYGAYGSYEYDLPSLNLGAETPLSEFSVDGSPSPGGFGLGLRPGRGWDKSMTGLSEMGRILDETWGVT